MTITTITATAIASALLVASPFTAEAAQADEMTPAEACTEISKLADTVMTGRQNGVRMADMINAIPGNEIGQAVVTAAFDEPRFNTAEYQQQAVTDFANNWFAGCMKAASE